MDSLSNERGTKLDKTTILFGQINCTPTYGNVLIQPDVQVKV